MADLPTSTDVVIAGAGPTGLTLALTLIRLGVDTRIVDPLPGPVTESRANLMHAGSLERFDVLGVAGELVDRGAVAHRSEIRSDGRLIAISDWTQLDTRFPMTLLIPQSTTEFVLDAALVAAGAGVARGWAVSDFTTNGESVEVAVTGEDEIRSIATRFLVGCDGAHSEVRKRMGVGFSGRSYPESLLVADCKATAVREGFSGVFFTRSDGFLVATGMRDGLTRIGASIDAGHEFTGPAISSIVASGHAPIDILDDYDEQRRAEATHVLANTHRLLRMYTATGVGRRLADTFVRLGEKVGVSDRITVEISGINSKWPPGVVRPLSAAHGDPST
jgi:2-polyprenyl-6-methoxyphenol hydroxylase-like FAD-dependent oxidoreductase